MLDNEFKEMWLWWLRRLDAAENPVTNHHDLDNRNHTKHYTFIS